ncbi:MAG: AGE family epimerase/isomerase [Pirellulales bacterium]|nr:AGE family epimerase/isomerase [Pirellulales bacterium]
MMRREFLGTLATVCATGAAATGSDGDRAADDEKSFFGDSAHGSVPPRLGGMTLEALRDDYRRRLFDEYLPFWEKGGYDRERGGFCCELNDDGSVAADEKYIWYQGRGLWVYSFLYNRFEKNPDWLRMAEKTKKFMVERMYAGEGRWMQKTRRDGTVLEGIGKTVFGDLFAALGLAQFYQAAGDPADLKLAKESIWGAMKAYDDPAYADIDTTRYTTVKVPPAGLRTQGHSMVLIFALSDLLSVDRDPELEQLQKTHVDRVVNHFWNAEYGIVNEYLRRDFTRIPEAADHMFAGHSLETAWIVMHEALRAGNRKLFDTLKSRIRRLLEMCYDYVFEGWGSENFHVFGTPDYCQGQDHGTKTMWAHCEIMIACLSILERTGESWAREWYDRTRDFVLKNMPVAGLPVWRQAVDRRGKDIKRVGISTKRKDNFHQVRMYMLNLLSIERMLKNRGPAPSRAAAPHGDRNI